MSEDIKQEKTILYKKSKRAGLSIYSVIKHVVLLLCILVCVAVSQANLATGSMQPKLYIGESEKIVVKKIHEQLKGQPAKYKTHGIDVSRYQRHISWPMVKLADVDFVFIKATEGIGLKDSFFDVNWSKAKDAGIRRGAYHFFLAEKDPALQAANFIFNTQLQPGDLPPVLDVEVTRGMSAEQIRRGVKVWLDMVENAYGKKPVLYTGYHFYNKYLDGHFEEYPLWIAHYKGHENPPACNDWLFWQYTDRGKLEGISKEVDLNVFKGSPQQLDEMCIADEKIQAYDFVVNN